jgi:hypothetical protein
MRVRVRIRVMVMPVVSPSIFTSEADLFVSEVESVVSVSVFGAAGGLLTVDTFCRNAMAYVFGIGGGRERRVRFRVRGSHG